MGKGKVALLILCLLVGFLSCNKDDGNGGTTVVEVRDRAEQQIADNDSIVAYLETHYYNASAFVSNLDSSISDLIISELPESGVLPDPTNNALLMSAVETKTVVFADTDYQFYILRLNDGGGDSPTFADTVRVNYEGFTLDSEVFDSAVTPVDFDLTSLVPGWRKVFPLFKTAENFINNGDGTVSYINHGAGVMFLPSGLGYFSNATVGISSYTPIVFKFELFQTSENDHDNDGVPSQLEDLNGDGEFTLDDDDTDEDNIPNYFDNDDDGDGILTIDEDINNDGDPTNDDSNGNGIPNYLDSEDVESKS